MPFVPRRQRSQELARGVRSAPGPTSSGAGEALANFGKTLESIGTDVLAQEKKAEDINYAFQAGVDDELEVSQFIENDRATQPVNGHTDRVKAFINEKYQSRAKDAPSEEAKGLYQQRTSAQYVGVAKKANIWERTKKTEEIFNNGAKIADRFAEEQLGNPDDFKALERINEIKWFYRNQQKESGLFSEADAEAQIKLETKKITKNYIESMIASGRAGEAKDLILAPSLKNKGKAELQPGQTELELSPEDGLKLGVFDADEALELRRAGATKTVKIGDVKNLDDLTKLDLSKRGQKTILDVLDADESAAYLKRLIAADKSDKSRTLSNLSDMQQNHREAGKQGRATDADSKAIVNMILDSGLDEFRSSKQLAILGMTDEMNKVISGIHEVKYNERAGFQEANFNEKEVIANIKKRFPGLKADSLGKAQIEQAKTQMAMELKAINRQAATDPVAYVMSTDPSLQKLAEDADTPAGREALHDAILRKEQELNLPKSRVTTKSQTQQIATDILGALESPQDIAAQMDLLESQYGKHFPKVLQETVQDNKSLPKGLEVLSWTKTPASRAFSMDVLTRGKEYLDSERVKVRATENDLKTAAGEKVDMLTSAIIGPDDFGINVGTTNALRDQITQGAAALMFKNGDLSMNDAIDSAYDQIVSANFYVTESGKVLSPESNVLVPRLDDDGKPISFAAVDAFMEAHSDAAGLAELDIPGAEGALKDVGVSGFETVPSGLSDLADNTRWVNSPNMDGIMLMFENKVTGEKVILYGKDGKPIQKSFKELSVGPYDKRTIEVLGTGTKEAGNF